MAFDLPGDFQAFKEAVVANQQDDNQGVYEVWWHANTRYPELPLSARLAIAEQAVADLLAEGCVFLVRGEWIGSAHERERVPDPQAALREFTTWVPQPDASIIWMADA